MESGSNVDAQDLRCGWTAFMQAVHHRWVWLICLSVCNYHLKDKLKVWFNSSKVFCPSNSNRFLNHKYTYCNFCRQHVVAELLIQYGADVSLKAMNGCSAFEVATFNSDTKMVQLIASTAMGKGKTGKQGK